VHEANLAELGLRDKRMLGGELILKSASVSVDPSLLLSCGGLILATVPS
jgi:hypothetical protein